MGMPATLRKLLDRIQTHPIGSLLDRYVALANNEALPQRAIYLLDLAKLIVPSDPDRAMTIAHDAYDLTKKHPDWRIEQYSVDCILVIIRCLANQNQPAQVQQLKQAMREVQARVARKKNPKPSPPAAAASPPSGSQPPPRSLPELDNEPFPLSGSGTFSLALSDAAAAPPSDVPAAVEPSEGAPHKAREPAKPLPLAAAFDDEDFGANLAADLFGHEETAAGDPAPPMASHLAEVSPPTSPIPQPVAATAEPGFLVKPGINLDPLSTSLSEAASADRDDADRAFSDTKEPTQEMSLAEIEAQLRSGLADDNRLDHLALDLALDAANTADQDSPIAIDADTSSWEPIPTAAAPRNKASSEAVNPSPTNKPTASQDPAPAPTRATTSDHHGSPADHSPAAAINEALFDAWAALFEAADKAVQGSDPTSAPLRFLQDELRASGINLSPSGEQELLAYWLTYQQTGKVAPQGLFQVICQHEDFGSFESLFARSRLKQAFQEFYHAAISDLCQAGRCRRATYLLTKRCLEPITLPWALTIWELLNVVWAAKGQVPGAWQPEDGVKALQELVQIRRLAA